MFSHGLTESTQCVCESGKIVVPNGHERTLLYAFDFFSYCRSTAHAKAPTLICEEEVFFFLFNISMSNDVRCSFHAIRILFFDKIVVSFKFRVNKLHTKFSGQVFIVMIYGRCFFAYVLRISR